MKIETHGNSVFITDRTYRRWFSGAVLIVFSLIPLSAGFSLLLRDTDYAVNFGILAAGLLILYVGARLIWKYPQIVCEFDCYTETLTYTQNSLFGRQSKIFKLTEIKKSEVVNTFAYLDGDHNNGKFRVELVFRNGVRCPVASRWTQNDHHCQEISDKINALIPKPNRRRKEKAEIWKDA